MPISGSGVFSFTPGQDAVSGTVVRSAQYNITRSDILARFNTVQPIALGGTGASTAAAALVALGGLAIADSLLFLDSIAALRALEDTDTTATVAFVMSWNDGALLGGGMFVMDVADETTADDSGVTIVDASGRRWNRCWDGSIDQYMFGAVGDGTTDDATAIGAMIDYAIANDMPIELKGGRHKLASAIVKTVSSGSTDKDFSMRGPGGRTCAFIAANATGGIKLSVGQQTQIYCGYFAMEPGVGGSGGSGYGLWLSGPAAGAGNRHQTVEHINFVPYDQNGTDYWFSDAPLKCTGMKRMWIMNCRYYPGSSATSDRKSNAFVDVSQSYQAKLINNWFNGRATYGLKQVVTGASNEGFTVEGNNFVGADYGIYYEDDAKSPNVRIVDNHLNSFVENIHIDGLKYGSIAGNVLYVNLDNITYTYSQSGTVVTATANQAHLFLAADTIDWTTRDTNGNLLESGSSTISATGLTSTVFKFDVGGTTLTLAQTLAFPESSRRFKDMYLLNAEGINISGNVYQQGEATTRHHVLISSDASLGVDELLVPNAIVGDIVIENDILSAVSIISPYEVAEATASPTNPRRIRINWDLPGTGASYPDRIAKIHSTVSECVAVPSDPVLYKVTTSVGNVGAPETDLASYDVDGAFYQDGHGVSIEAWGSTANNGTAKTVQLYFNSVSILTETLDTGVAGEWRLEANFYLRTNGNIRYWAQFFDNNATGNIAIDGNVVATITAAIPIKVTGDANADNDILLQGFIVRVI
jgi:hypothetical protein